MQLELFPVQTALLTPTIQPLKQQLLHFLEQTA